MRILAETVASLPLPVYRRVVGGGKERAQDHYLYPLLHDQPNPEMTSFEFRETTMGYLALWGNAYAEIERDNAGRVQALWLLRPDRMRVTRDTQGLRYEYSLPDGQSVILRQQNVMHIRGLSGDGIIGYSPIRMAREAIGLALATEEYGARFFGQGSTPSGVLEYPGKLSEEAVKGLRRSWEDLHSGLSGAHRVAILQEGLKWSQVGIPPEDAQFLACREFQTTEIARIFRVPPYLLQDYSRATFSNVEHTAISFVVHTVRPWLVRWEQAFKRDLFSVAERETYFAEFLVDGLLRGDIDSRYRAYATARQWGWMSADDIRGLENQNPLPDGQGKIYMVPLNMVPASAVVVVPPVDEAKRQVERRDKPKLPVRVKRPRQYLPVFLAAAKRLVRWEISEVRNLLRKRLDITELEAWYEKDETQRRLRAYIHPAVASYAAIIASDVEDEIGSQLLDGWAEMQAAGYSDIYVRDHIHDSRGQLRALSMVAEPDAAVNQRLDEWDERRPGKIADWETVNAAGVFARLACVALGVKLLRWAAVGAKPCPYCQTLDGMVVDVKGTFAQNDVQAEGQEPMRLNRSPRNPPLHEGCVCAILPA
ncbi:MAG: hypothetical protein DDT20_01217 [Firmicutes bacterium]|nr:hypothetical protein [Bacillota bacterium]